MTSGSSSICIHTGSLWFRRCSGASSFSAPPASVIDYLPIGNAHSPLLIAIVVLGFLVLCRLTVLPLARWRDSQYVFTTRRVLIRRGVLRRVGRDLPLQHIHDVTVSQSLWDRIVAAGTITIESGGEHGTETLNNLRRPGRVQQLLRRLIAEDGKRRARPANGGAVQYERPPGLTGDIRNSNRPGSGGDAR